MSIFFVREVTLRYRGPRRGASFDAVSAPQTAADFMRRVLPDNVREHFLTLFLDTRNQVVGYFVAATGTASSCPVGVKEVFQAAVVAGAASILVGHNHPTGDPVPSAEDKAVTKRLGDAGEFLGIPVLDHLIIGSSGFYSFHEHGELPPRKPPASGAPG
jgi:DNA repair protein RadC